MKETISEIDLSQFTRERLIDAVSLNSQAGVVSPEIVIALAAMDSRHVNTLLDAISTVYGLNDRKAREVASIVESVEEMLP